jgi:hypothetical protein
MNAVRRARDAQMGDRREKLAVANPDDPRVAEIQCLRVASPAFDFGGAGCRIVDRRRDFATSPGGTFLGASATRSRSTVSPLNRATPGLNTPTTSSSELDAGIIDGVMMGFSGALRMGGIV